MTLKRRDQPAELQIIWAIALVSTIITVVFSQSLYQLGTLIVLPKNGNVGPDTNPSDAVAWGVAAGVLVCAATFFRAIWLRRWACVTMVSIFALATAYFAVQDMSKLYFEATGVVFIGTCSIVFIITMIVLVARNYRYLKSGF